MFTQLSDNYFIWPAVIGLIILIPIIFIAMLIIFFGVPLTGGLIAPR